MVYPMASSNHPFQSSSLPISPKVEANSQRVNNERFDAQLDQEYPLGPLFEDDADLTIDPRSEIDPYLIWQNALSELALQMPAATYDTWMRDTRVMGYEDGDFYIGMPNAYARDWLENRMRKKIKRTLTKLVGRSVQIHFSVSPKAVVDSPQAKPAPLYDTHNEILNEHQNYAPENPALRASQIAQNQSAKRQCVENGKERDHQVASASGGANPTQSTAQRECFSSGQIADFSATSNYFARPSNLNANHTFEAFVVGNHNRLAHAAAAAVAEKPGQSFNPLFIYGGVGLGKTHVLHAIGNCAYQHGHRMLYCSSEQFTNELISAIRNQKTDEFRNKYRQVDILLIDDIQFIGGKESTQEEFFHTFNHLHAASRQVVLSSDRPPKALATLEERLRSRFEGGLQADISQPDFETRVAILQSKAMQSDLPIALDVLMLIAERVDTNIRELEGTLNRMVMQARLFDNRLDFGLAESILRNLAPQRTPRSPAVVVDIVAEHYHLTSEDLKGRTRTKEIAGARQIAMYLLREENGLSLPAIGDQLGGRDHSTVRYGVEKITLELEKDELLRREIMTLREKIYSVPGT